MKVLEGERVEEIGRSIGGGVERRRGGGIERRKG